MQTLTRPYRVTFPMVLLVSMVPFYILIADSIRGRPMNAPELDWDRLVPLQPTWALVYGSLYLFLILLPVFLVRQEEHLRRTVFAYLSVWMTAYACFLAYPTEAPRPPAVVGDGFAAWGLRFLYDADPPYNCFPSLHVAHSFVSALACYRVHAAIGIVAVVSAALVGVSTLFTKQHYILDVVAGVALASLAYVAFMRGARVRVIPEHDHFVAPVLALVVVGIVIVAFACYWVAYLLSGRM